MFHIYEIINPQNIDEDPEAAVAPVRERERRALVPAEALATSVGGGPMGPMVPFKRLKGIAPSGWLSMEESHGTWMILGFSTVSGKTPNSSRD